MKTAAEITAVEIAEEISGRMYIEGRDPAPPTPNREVFVLRIAKKRYVKNVNKDGIETVSHPAQAFWYPDADFARHVAKDIGNPAVLKFSMALEIVS